MIRYMLPAFTLLAAACAAEPNAQTPETSEGPVSSLPLERLFQSPSLSGPSPRALAFSPDGTMVTFLKPREDDTARLDLWAFDVASGEASLLVDSKILEPEEVELSEQEKALRERQRTAGQKGILSYDWGSKDTILVPIGGDLHLITLSEISETPDIKIDLLPEATALGISMADVGQVIREAYFGEEAQRLPRDPGAASQVPPTTSLKLDDLEITTSDGSIVPLNQVARLVPSGSKFDVKARQLTETDAFEFDAKVSPKGKYVSFIRDNALFAIELATGEETQLTPDADPENAISYGVAEFVAQEEMRRYTGYWWSPDASYVAYTRVDESTVDIVPRFDIAADSVTVIEQRYPKAGRPNAIVDLFVQDIASGDVAEVNWRRDDWGPATDQYLTRVNWSREDDTSLIVQRVDRDQTKIDYMDVIIGDELSDLQVTFLAAEEHATWVNITYDLRLGKENRILTSEASGFRHIVEFDDDDAFRQITSGDWAVSSIEGQAGETIFFTGYKDTPLESHLYSVPFSGGEPTRITPLGSSWAITMSPDGQSYIGRSSSPTQPPQTGLYRADGTLITWIEENALDEDHPYSPYLADHTVPEYGTLTAEDGQTLYYSIQVPPDFDETRKYPALVEVYGGPHAQMVTRNWERLSDQYYSREGYIVFRLDNRGSDNRGRKFEDAIYRRTGGPEVRDQLVGVDYLKSLPFVDADRIGIQGWSYGGYMTLMTLLQAPEGTFAAAVSGAPVTDWSLYDTFYTERYMDTPQDNAEGYEASSVFPYLDNLNSPLLLIHGMADDNVVFENSTRLYAELQQRGKPFEMMTYPGQRHGIRSEELQTHLMRSRMAFLNRHLKPGE